MAGKGDMNDGAWRYITEALNLGRARATEHGYTWSGESCFVVSAMALGAVILTRRGIKPTSGPMAGQYLLPNADPASNDLAYADHYLHMRGEAARLGPNYRWKLEAQTEGYEAVKRGIRRMRDMPWTGIVGVPVMKDFYVLSTPLKAMGEVADWALRESDKPLSPPSKESLYWGLEGIKDGLTDYAANPGIDNDPDWFGQMQGA